MAPAPTRDDVARARETLGDLHRTPTFGSRTLSELTGAQVYLKAELFQRTGSFKVRGVLNKLASLGPAEKAAGVCTWSAGNAAQAVAYAAALEAIPCRVFMWRTANPGKVAATRGYGADVDLDADDAACAYDRIVAYAEETGSTFVHPFDDPVLQAGHGTIALEIEEDVPRVDVVVVPIGGGGLISGVSSALKSIEPGIRVVGVESSGAPAMQRSVVEGRRIELEQVDCAIDGLKVRRVGEHTLEIVSRMVDEIVTLPDETIFEALLWTLSRTKIVVEGAAAAPVAALLNGLVDAPAGSKVVAVLSGGNIDLEQLRGLTWN
jgi:threonine dehydratase